MPAFRQERYTKGGNIDWVRYMLEQDIVFEKLSTVRGYITSVYQNRELRDIVESTAQTSPSGERFQRLMRGLGGVALSLPRFDMSLYSIRREGEMLGLASVLPGVSIVHGSTGQLNRGIELDYVCREGAESALQQDIVSRLRAIGDASHSTSDSRKYGMSHQIVREHDPTRNGNTRIVRKQFTSYISAAPSEDSKMKTLETHPMFDKIEGIAPLELSDGGDQYGVTKSHIGLVLFETKKHLEISAE